MTRDTESPPRPGAPWHRAVRSFGGLSVVELGRRAAGRASELDLVSRSAAIAYYAFSALVPFLVVLLTLTIVMLPTQTRLSADGEPLPGRLTDELESSITRFLPSNAVEVLEGQITRIQEQPPYGILSIGLLLSLWLASGVFQEIIAALNRIHGVEESRARWKRYLTAILMTVVEATILIASLLTIVLWPQVTAWLQLGPLQAVLATVAQWVVVTGAVLLSFALALYLAPNVTQRWRWVTPGSMLGTVAFLLMSLLLRVYVQGYGSYDATYGSLGGIVVLLLWIQMSALILLAAAMINQLICSALSRTPYKDGCPPLPREEDAWATAPASASSARELHRDSPSNRAIQHAVAPSTESRPMNDATRPTDAPRQEPLRAMDVMTNSFRTCGRFSTVTEAVLIFKEVDCGMVPVVEEGKPIGVVTDRDVALALASHANLASEPVCEIMSEDVAAIAPETPLWQVVREFGRDGVRRLLVVDAEGFLVGLIAWADIIPHLPEFVVGKMVGDVVEQP